MGKSAVSINNISKSYKKVAALSGISLEIKEGEIFGIIGPDGAGKTTLYRILTGLMLPDTGEAVVDGVDVIKQHRQLKRHIGYMPGRFSLYQDLSVEENLKFFATVYGTSIEENYDLIRDIYSQIEPFKTRRAGALSGGMKQKLALSCALIHAPRVLFLDEPTTGVDPVSRKELWEMLIKLNRERYITIVASTPYRDEVMCCHRIALLQEGKIAAVGLPQEVMPEEKGLQHEALTTTDEDVIVAENLTKRFGDFTAVDHISLRVKRGEIFGFLGANGAGKTTAMRIFCGLSKQTEGKAVVAGLDCATESEAIKRSIGYMSQKFSLYEDLTIAENLRLFGGIYGLSRFRIKEKTAQLLAELGLQDRAGEMVRSLPLGWKQRLAFSVSIMHEPRIVFLDEPTGGVDSETRRQFWQLIYRAAERGITVFVTTHYMDEAEYCDRISIMVDGRIAAMDTPSRLKEIYKKERMYDVFLYLARKATRL